MLGFPIRLKDGWEEARQEWKSLMGKNSKPGVVVNICNLNIERSKQGGKMAISLWPACTKEYSALKGQKGAL